MAQQSIERTFSHYEQVGMSGVLETERPTHSDYEDDEPTIIRGNNRVAESPDAIVIDLAERRRRAEEVQEAAAQALLGKQAVGVMVAAVVSEDGDAVGRETVRYIDLVHAQTGPIDIVTTEDEIKVIEAAAELARAVEAPARDEAVEVLKQQLAEARRLIDTDKLVLQLELERERSANAKLRRDIVNKDETIKGYQEDKKAEALRAYKAIRGPQVETTIEAARPTVGQRVALGARSALAFFTAPDRI